MFLLPSGEKARMRGKVSVDLVPPHLRPSPRWGEGKIEQKLMLQSTMLKRWKIKTPDPQLQVSLSDALRIHPIIIQLLINRQIKTPHEAEHFLKADLASLHDPFFLLDMDEAVTRIKKAQAAREKVLIYGDYDVDGVTSSAILRNVLKKMDMEVINYIPHRLEEGYGLNLKIVDMVRQKGVTLLITVDCGITAFKEVEALKQNGIDVIIIDHHHLSEGRLPGAVAVINPRRPDCPYPFKELASVGLAAKLSQALLGEKETVAEYLELVALGTIADVVSLQGENRIFVKNGLPRMAQTKNKGLLALLDVAKLKGKPLRPYYVGFILGPRINATGRMGSAHQSLDLLLSESEEEAYALARNLDEQNAERQKTQSTILAEAMGIVEQQVNFKDHRVIVIHKDGWHKGVLGIVASRLVEKYYRPAIVISTEGGIGTASARSISGFHLVEALSHCAGCLENFGGHRLAAGLTVKSEHITNFRETINAFAQTVIKAEDLIPALEIDAQIPLASLTLDLMKAIEGLEPYGEGNLEPVFCSLNLTVKGQPALMGKDTIKFWVTDGEKVLSVVGFGMGKFQELIRHGTPVDVAYHLFIDDWNKKPTVALKLKDLRLRDA